MLRVFTSMDAGCVDCYMNLLHLIPNILFDQEGDKNWLFTLELHSQSGGGHRLLSKYSLDSILVSNSKV